MKLAPYHKFLNSRWVNARLRSMSIREMIGQLFIVEAFSETCGSDNEKHIINCINKYGIGGITFFQGSLENQARLSNKFQSLTKIPLFINMDAEWGLGMRLNDAIIYPYNMALGAIENNDLIYKFAKNLARQLKRVGAHSPLAPVADISSNPDNPVINYRSFGENKFRVAEKITKFIKGLQEENILDVAKHFPGHGDTSTDSHLGMPVLEHDLKRIEQIELFPFKEFINNGGSAIMTAHIHIPAIDPTSEMPASLSERSISELLKNKLGFEGLVVSDALDMHGISKYYKDGEADPLSVKAGTDMISLSTDIEKGIESIYREVINRDISISDIEQKCRSILAMKHWLKLDKYHIVKTENILEDINNEQSRVLNQELADAATTIIKYNGKVKLSEKEDTAFVYISNRDISLSEWSQIQHHQQAAVQKKYRNTFAERMIINRGDKNHYFWNSSENTDKLKDIAGKLMSYDRIVISVHGLNIKPLNNFDVPLKAVPVLAKLFSDTRVTFILFGNAYALRYFDKVELCENIIITYQENEYFHNTVAELLTMGKYLSATLPVTVSKEFKEGCGISGLIV